MQLLNYGMNIFQNIAIGVLAIAVAFLMYRQFADHTPQTDPTTPSQSKPHTVFIQPDSGNTYGAVAFVNTDTLLQKFDSFKKMRATFEKRSAQAEAELQTRSRALQMEYLETQKKVQAGTMTELLVKDAEQSLMRKQQELEALRDSKTGQLMEEEKNLSQKLNDQIHSFMKEYAPAHGLKYVLGYTRGGGILYAADSLDITYNVLEGLNEKYKGK